MGIWKSTIEACNDNMNWKPNIAPSEQFRTVINHRYDEEKSFCSRKVQSVRNPEGGNLAVAACNSLPPHHTARARCYRKKATILFVAPSLRGWWSTNYKGGGHIGNGWQWLTAVAFIQAEFDRSMPLSDLYVGGHKLDIIFISFGWGEGG